MITVAILINGQPIFTRSARNTLATNSKGQTIYEVDDGKTIAHKREDGAVPLAIAMLELIEEPKRKTGGES